MGKVVDITYNILILEEKIINQVQLQLIKFSAYYTVYTVYLCQNTSKFLQEWETLIVDSLFGQ